MYENFEVEWSVIDPETALARKEQAEPAAQKPSQAKTEPEEKQEPQVQPADSKSIVVIVNGRPIPLDKKENYLFVDIFDYIDFDLAQSNGRAIVTKINGVDAKYTQDLRDGDKIDIYWKEN